nr:zinc finger, CCHC-type [Tanacetum cinerariifolium]
MASSITMFNIEKFDGNNDFGLWKIKMCALMVQQRCDAALETLPADMKAGEKAALMKKAYSTLILCLGDRATLNSKELKKRTEGTKKEAGDGLYVKEDGHLKRDCPKKKSSGFVKKGKRDQDYDSSDDEGNAYFEEALMVVGNDEMTELVMDSGGSYHMIHMRDFLYDFKGFDGGSVQLGDNRTCTIKGTWKVKIQLHDVSSFILEDVRYILGLRRSLIPLGTLEKKGYTMKMQMGRIKVIKSCRVMMTVIRKNNCVYTLEAKVMTFGVQKHGGSKQVGLKQLGYKQIGFKQLGHKQVGFKQLGPGIETGIYGVQVEKPQRRLKDKQLEEKTNTDCLVKEQEKVHLGIKVGANITVIGVPGQEGAKGNVARKKKVKVSMKANLGKLLKGYQQINKHAEAVGQLVRLERLSISGNQLSTLPETIGSLRNLLLLNVSNNHLKFLPESIGSCFSLEELQANENSIEEIPPSVCNLFHLKSLCLDRNKVKQRMLP